MSIATSIAVASAVSVGASAASSSYAIAIWYSQAMLCTAVWAAFLFLGKEKSTKQFVVSTSILATWCAISIPLCIYITR